MRRRCRVFSLLCAGTALGAALPALALHDTPRRAEMIRLTLGRAVAPCGAPNATHAPPLALGACAPSTQLSAFAFGPAGRGEVRLRRTRGPDLQVAVQLADVRDPGGDLSGAAFETEVVLRLTDDACAGSSCTSEDLSLRVPTPCSRGQCRGKGTLGGAAGIGVGPCNIAVQRVQVLDATGAPFAEGGIALGGPAPDPHNVPREARRLSFDLGRAFGVCTAPNATHDPPLSVGACSPHAALSTFRFGAQGRGQVKVSRIAAGPDVRVAVLVRDVRDAGGAPAEGAFETELVLRITDHGCGVLPCTAEDVSLVLATPCSAGSCQGGTTLEAALGSGGASFGPRMLAVQAVRVRDASGAAFAEPAIKLP